ncbi:MAG TPA: DUF6702 family protein [Puia sp.]|nr:DUF6702 family protein [Puia sp.]
MAASLFKWFIAGITLLFSGVSGRGVLELHPLYITVTEITHNAKERTLEISCKVFTNDFETVLGKLTTAKVDLTTPKDKKVTDKLIADYVMKYLLLKIDGKPVALHFVGSENQQEATWSYYQVNDIPSLKKMEITNSLLYDGFDQEINIMHVTVGGERKSNRLNYPDVSAVVEF